jgi:hypothetical protein
MKNMTVLFVLTVAALLTGCNKTPSVQAQTQTENKLKIGEGYKVILVQSPMGCTLSPTAWVHSQDNDHLNHHVMLLGFGQKEVALVKVLQGIDLPAGNPQLCKQDEVVHVPSWMLVPDKE